MTSITEISGKMESGILSIDQLSKNEKPLVTFQGHAIKNGSQLFEMDTRKSYKYDEENHKWWPLNP